MRRPARRSGDHGEAGRVNVTPMIDVVMVLIVFFLLVGQLAADRNERVDLPAASLPTARSEQASSPVPRTIVVNALAADGEGARKPKLIIDGEAVEPAQLASVFAGAGGVRVRADRTLPFGTVEPVLVAARNAGVREIEIALAEPSAGGRP